MHDDEQAGDPTSGDGDADTALVAALLEPSGDEAGSELLTLEQVAASSGLPVSVLEALEREGLLVPRSDAAARYTPSDVDALAAGLTLLEAGVPLAELLDLGRRFDEAMRTIADDAVETFLRFVRDPLHAAHPDGASAQLVAAFRRMLPAASSVVAHHFQRLLLASAQERVRAREDDDG